MESKTNYDELVSKHNELLGKYDELNKEKNIKNELKEWKINVWKIRRRLY